MSTIWALAPEGQGGRRRGRSNGRGNRGRGRGKGGWGSSVVVGSIVGNGYEWGEGGSQRSMVQYVHGGSRRGTVGRPVHIGSDTEVDGSDEEVVAAATRCATIAAVASLG